MSGLVQFKVWVSMLGEHLGLSYSYYLNLTLYCFLSNWLDLLTIVETDTTSDAFELIAGIQQMLNVIIRLIISYFY